MSHEIVPIGADELAALHRVIETAFGHESTQERVDEERSVVEYDRFFGVHDGSELVAGGGAYSFELTLPRSPGSAGSSRKQNADTMAVAGVTWIGVLPTHRRRGILRRMMEHQLDDVAARGEAVAVLTASEGAIYQRFGYGVATQVLQAEIPKSGGQFLHEPAAGGRCRLLWGEARKDPLMAVYDAWRRERPGALSRHGGFWDVHLADRPHRRGGGNALFVVVHESDSGEIDGYARYRTKDRERFDDKLLMVQEVIAGDPEVEAALWRFLLDVDLIGAVEASVRPLDDPLRWRLLDPRAYRVRWLNDWLWARIVDVPSALSARSYPVEGSLVLEVLDAMRPDGAAAGRFQLEGGPDGASCKPTDASPDLTLPVDALGATWLGAVPFTTLAAAGRIDASREALLRADSLFRSTPLPFCNTPF